MGLQDVALAAWSAKETQKNRAKAADLFRWEKRTRQVLEAALTDALHKLEVEPDPNAYQYFLSRGNRGTYKVKVEIDGLTFGMRLLGDVDDPGDDPAGGDGLWVAFNARDVYPVRDLADLGLTLQLRQARQGAGGRD